MATTKNQKKDDCCGNCKKRNGTRCKINKDTVSMSDWCCSHKRART